MKKERIVTRRWGDRRKGKTDWARFDAMTDEEVEASVANDPDWAEFKDIDWSDAVLVIPARKKAISIRVDEDVLDYFKSEGEGYQRRINAVLRSVYAAEGQAEEARLTRRRHRSRNRPEAMRGRPATGQL